jgi:hypothetical protein
MVLTPKNRVKSIDIGKERGEMPDSWCLLLNIWGKDIMDEREKYVILLLKILLSLLNILDCSIKKNILKRLVLVNILWATRVLLNVKIYQTTLRTKNTSWPPMGKPKIQRIKY